MPTPHRRKISAIVSKLLEWYPKNARNLPWRRTRDPYGIWVSEIMLQQTQVKTVVPYWKRWMRALPTIDALARAKPQKIHKLWEGLGYYTRVRNMQKAARLILEKHERHFPTDFEEVLALPGIGRYTAGAICSIAFNQPQPILDGNVVRVLTRLFGIEGNPRDRSVNVRLWDLAANLVLEAAVTWSGAKLPSPQPFPKGRGSSDGPRCQSPSRCGTLADGETFSLSQGEKVGPSARRSSFGRAGGVRGIRAEASLVVMSGNRTSQIAQRKSTCSRLNQSLMELGALVCTPRQPRCECCPVSNLCIARKQHRVDDLPNVSLRAPTTRRCFVAFVARHGGRFLVRQRPPGVVNAHLWEFPNIEVLSDDGDPRMAALKVFGVTPILLEPLCTIRHSITRYRIRLDVFQTTAKHLAQTRREGIQWLRRSELGRLPFASAHKKILAVL